ncbi:hypothetical protein Q7P37_006420 [Cladosporium fusiforme]
MTTLSQDVPEGNKAPLISLDDDHHGSWLVICSAFGLVIVLLTLIIRIYLRYKVSPPFAADDICLTVATALAVIQCALVFAGVNKGDGTSIDLIEEQNLVPIQELNYAANLFYVLALYASKACVVLLFKRISSGIMKKKIAWAAMAVIMTTGVISIFLCALRCDLSQPWIQFGSSQCDSLFAQWQAITAFDIATEAMLFAMAVYLVWGLQTAFSGKFRVVFAFGLRLPVIIIAGLHIHYLDRELSSDNQTLTGVIATICRQTEIFYAIMASTIPCLRPFLASFFTGFGAMGGETVIAGSQVGNSREKSGQTYAMGSMQSAESESRRSKRRSRHQNNRRQAPLPQSNSSPRLDRDLDNFGNDAQNHAMVTTMTNSDAHQDASSRGGVDASSITSNESTRMIIKKEVQWHVDSERGDMPRA